MRTLKFKADLYSSAEIEPAEGAEVREIEVTV
jgi:hypothetical protein